ncbi:MAG: hypothetical protein AABY10_04605 [Nanoarchaeota archaeon]
MSKNILIVSLVIVVSLIAVGFLFYTLQGSNSENFSNNGDSGGRFGIVKNSIENLSDEEAALKFDESFVLYVLYNLGANNLHNPPLSSEKPKIEFNFDSEVFNAEVMDGEIFVNKGSIDDEDIKIVTTKEEIVKMIRNSLYVEQSFNEGKSRIEMVAGKVKLLSKGYLQMYKALTGKEAP